MSTTARKRPRSPRVTSFELPPGRAARLLAALQRGDVLLRLAFCLVAALTICALCRAWAPSFAFREAWVPPRDVSARVAFQRPDPQGTEKARERAAAQEPYVYMQNPKELQLLRGNLDLALLEITSAATLGDLRENLWKEFQPSSGDPDRQANLEQQHQEEQFEQFRAALGGQAGLDAIKAAVGRALAPMEQQGLLEKLPEQHGEGNRKEIVVYPFGRPTEQYLVQVNDVLIGDASALKKRLDEELQKPDAAERIFYWLRPRLRSTLSLDPVETQRRREAAVAAVPQQFTFYDVGMVLAPRALPLSVDTLQILRAEHEKWLAQQSGWYAVQRTSAILLLIAALMALCGYYVYYREPALLESTYNFSLLLVAAVATMAMVSWTSAEPARAEIIPVLLFGMTFGIAFHRDVALLLSMSLAVLVAVTCGQGIGAFLILSGTAVAAILQLGRIRARSKLIRVAALAASVTFLLSLGVTLLEEQPLGAASLAYSGRNALWTFVAGFLMTGLLPAVEKVFGVLTEISLLELGDASHPLLQELVRRAPGTYNHSINVASIAEAAAESVGAKGLLVRVGAYFHDIGKMLKPDYFVENQGPAGNRHDTLNPAMSTLIIIAHIKDGADLARQHRLPAPMIHFIEQHHGTTLVEYFYQRASQQSESNPDGGAVHESSFRYPGPKPQTIEAAVLMLADAVESASRTLAEPTPARIEGLVDDIAMKRLLDGQFDECGLTLQQLRSIQQSMVKSLTAVYHGRVKYPAQQTA